MSPNPSIDRCLKLRSDKASLTTLGKFRHVAANLFKLLCTIFYIIKVVDSISILEMRKGKPRLESCYVNETENFTSANHEFDLNIRYRLLKYFDSIV